MSVTRFSVVLGLSLAGLVSGCASVATSPAGSVLPSSEPASPAPVAGYDWHLTADEGIVLLAYGIAESDELKLGLQCGTGSGRVDVTSTGPSGARTILLESGGETERLDALGEPSELHEGDLLTAQAGADAPVFQRFRRLGWMAQWIGDRREAYASQPGSQAGVERFFALCD